MSDPKSRLSVLPSDMALQQMKHRLESTRKGFALLKKKSDALRIKFHSIASELKEEKEGMAKMFKLAYFSLSEARYHSQGNDLSFALLDRSKKSVQVSLDCENIAGVKFPTFKVQDESELKELETPLERFRRRFKKGESITISRGGE